ncbi:hypothetical protein ACHAW6_013343 [Cyclotella cf. meneghiniana]
MPLMESFNALSLTKEMDDARLDLIKDLKAGGRPEQGNMKPIAKGEHLMPLKESFKVLILTKEMDDAWLDLI